MQTFQPFPQPSSAHRYGFSIRSASKCSSLVWSSNSPDVEKHLRLVVAVSGQQLGYAHAYGRILGLLNALDYAKENLWNSWTYSAHNARVDESLVAKDGLRIGFGFFEVDFLARRAWFIRESGGENSRELEDSCSVGGKSKREMDCGLEFGDRFEENIKGVDDAEDSSASLITEGL